MLKFQAAKGGAILAATGLAAALLARVAHDYSAQWTEAEQEFAGLLDVTVLRPWPAVTLVSNALRVETVVGQPHQLTWQGVTLDVAMHLHTPIARGAVAASEHDWLLLSALQGSILEHDIFEQLFLVDSISADKGLQLARAQGMVVHHLDALSFHEAPDGPGIGKIGEGKAALAPHALAQDAASIEPQPHVVRHDNCLHACLGQLMRKGTLLRTHEERAEASTVQVRQQ